MPLYKINDFDPDYRNTPDSVAIQNFDVYSDRNEKIGRVADALVDQAGNFRYLVIDISGWFSGKQVLVPLGRSRIDLQNQRVYLHGLSKSQAKKLPTYHGETGVDYQHEEDVRNVYRVRTVDDSAPLESSAPLEAPRVRYTAAPMQQPSAAVPPQPVTPPVAPAQAAYTAETYNYQQDPDLYGVNDRDHRPFVQYHDRVRDRVDRRADDVVINPPIEPSRVVHEDTIPLREERLIVDKHKQKAGEVIVRKEIETEIIEVPIQREKLIIEQVGPEPKQLAEIDLADENDIDPELLHGIDPNTIRRTRRTRRPPQ